jgi:hypothetical protein
MLEGGEEYDTLSANSPPERCLQKQSNEEWKKFAAASSLYKPGR